MPHSNAIPIYAAPVPSVTMPLLLTSSVPGEANLCDYGIDAVCKQITSERMSVARRTLDRLIKHLGLRSVRRGKVVRTTISDAHLR